MKNIFFKTACIAFIVIALCSVLGSCKKKNEPKSYQDLIVGSWAKIKEVTYVDGKEDKTFNSKSGTILRFDSNGIGSFGPYTFDYEFEDNLLFIMEKNDKRCYYIYELNENILVMKYEFEDGDTNVVRHFIETYKRIR